MAQTARLQTRTRLYVNGVIEALQKKQGIDRDQAKQLLLRYYRPMKRNWGFEPNVDEFADQIIDIDRIVKRAQAGGGSGPMIRWKRKKGPANKITATPRV